jgi:flagellar biosynthesis chaperone FliJ
VKICALFFTLFKELMATVVTKTASSAEESPAKPQTSTIRLNVEQQCPIQNVTVYNDRAEVTRLVRHHFDGEGTYDLVFHGFSPSVDLTSLHVSGGTGKACTILEVSYQTRYEDPTDSTPLSSVEQLQNELTQIQTETEQHQRELARLDKQRAWLDGRASKLMNQDGQVSNNDLEIMQQFMEFYYKTLIKLDDDTAREDLKIKQLTQQQTEFKTKINEHGAEGAARRRKAVREVTVTVHLASSNIDVTLEVSYLISNCSWSASYDVRVNSSEASRQRTQLTYYGIIVSLPNLLLGQSEPCFRLGLGQQKSRELVGCSAVSIDSNTIIRRCSAQITDPQDRLLYTTSRL